MFLQKQEAQPKIFAPQASTERVPLTEGSDDHQSVLEKRSNSDKLPQRDSRDSSRQSPSQVQSIAGSASAANPLTNRNTSAGARDRRNSVDIVDVTKK